MLALPVPRPGCCRASGCGPEDGSAWCTNGQTLLPRVGGRACWTGEWGDVGIMLMRSVRKPRRAAVHPEPSPGRAPRRAPRAPRLHPAEETHLWQGRADAGTGIPCGRLTLGAGFSCSRRKARFGLKGFHFGSVGRWEQSAVPALQQLHPLSPPHAALFAPFPFSLHGHAHIHVAPGGLSS